MMDEDSKTLAVVVQRLDDLKSDMTALRSELVASRADVVARGEWVQRNTYVDSKLDTVGREISELKQERAAARAPWWAVAGVITSGLVLVWAVISALINAGAFSG